MKWFLDTEFDENGTTIKLISIALVCEDGREYYAVAADGWRSVDCSHWVRENVIPNLSLPDRQFVPKMRKQIAEEISDLLLPGADKHKPEIWGYFACYDWVAFCQLYGRLIDLPSHFPKYCMDLKQERVLSDTNRDDLPKLVGVRHNALVDARWHKAVYDYLLEYRDDEA